MKDIFNIKEQSLLAALLILLLSACVVGNGDEEMVNNTGFSDISSGKIMFAAHNTSNPDGDLRLFVINNDGTGLTDVSESLGCAPLFPCDSPDIEDMPGGGWRIAFVQNGGIKTFDTRTGVPATDSPIIGGRPDFNEDASDIVFMGGGAEGLNIWRVSLDQPSAEIQLTISVGSTTAEFPYFSPVEDRVVYVASFGERPRQIVDGDGSNSAAIPAPGGNTVSHMGFKADGTEFVNAQNLTSYLVQTGAIGTLNDLKNTTTIMSQLLALGYAEVPKTKALGQGDMGTFALSVDWSRDGRMLVFDALVQDATTGEIKGIAIFVYEIETDKLTLIFGPEPFNGNITNNFNFSMYTPKWIP